MDTLEGKVAELQVTNSDLVEAVNDQTDEVVGKLGEIEQRLTDKENEVDLFLQNQGISHVYEYSQPYVKYLLMAELGGGNFQFHGQLLLLNWTTSWFGLVSLRKYYSSEFVDAAIAPHYGTGGISVCKVTYNGKSYLALRNDGEINRSWRFVGTMHLNSQITAFGVEEVDSVDEVITT